MIRPVDDADLVSSRQIALDNYSQITSGSQRFRKALDEFLVVHADSKAPAWHPWLGYLQDSAADLPAWSSPSRLTPRAAMRPATGVFQIALLAGL
jgi:hypothetical protein